MISGPDLKYLLNKNGMNNVLVEVTRGMSAKNPRENPPKNKRKSYPKWPKTRGAANKRLKSQLASKPKSRHSLLYRHDKHVWSGKSRQPIRKELSKCQPIRGGFANEEVQLTRRVGWNGIPNRCKQFLQRIFAFYILCIPYLLLSLSGLQINFFC